MAVNLRFAITNLQRDFARIRALLQAGYDGENTRFDKSRYEIREWEFAATVLSLLTPVSIHSLKRPLRFFVSSKTAF